jgi:hypothetical protein
VIVPFDDGETFSEEKGEGLAHQSGLGELIRVRYDEADGGEVGGDDLGFAEEGVVAIRRSVGLGPLFVLGARLDGGDLLGIAEEPAGGGWAWWSAVRKRSGL